MSKFVRSLLFVVIVFTTGKVVGQSAKHLADSPLRKEFPAVSTNASYRLIPCDTIGLMFLYKSNETAQENMVKWYFISYDRNFEQKWMRQIPVMNGLTYSGYFRRGHMLDVCFTATAKMKNQKFNAQVLRINLTDGNAKMTSLNTPDAPDFVQLISREKSFYLALNTPPQQSCLVILDVSDDTVYTHYLYPDLETSIQQISVDTMQREINALVRIPMNKKQSTFALLTTNLTGQKKTETVLNLPGEDYSLTYARLEADNAGNTCIAGTYTPPRKMSAANGKIDRSHEADGFFLSVGKGHIFSPLFLLPLKEMQQSMNPDTTRKDQEIGQSRKKDNKLHDNQTDIQFILRNLFIIDDTIYFHAESYFPQYHTETYTEYDFYGRPYTATYSVFDGYRFTAVLLQAITMTGRYLWSSRLPVSNVLNDQLQGISMIFKEKEGMIMVYAGDGKIASKKVRYGEETAPLEYSGIELSASTDKVIEATEETILHWYDHYFLCQGYQQVKNIRSSNKKSRLIFYFNKLFYNTLN